MRKNSKKAFTFTELIVWVTILAILWTVGFTHVASNISTSRDSVRGDDFAKLELYLSNYKEKNGVYPLPWEWFNITNNWKIVAVQWKMNDESILDAFEIMPVDPTTKNPYVYWVTSNRSAYQLATTLENDGIEKSLVIWNYNSVSKNVLPTIILAMTSEDWSSVEINDSDTDWAINRNAFVFNQSTQNRVYGITDSEEPVIWNLVFDELLAKAESEWYWQNHDYEDCEEIKDWGKYIWDGQYQALVSDVLTDVVCP